MTVQHNHAEMAIASIYSQCRDVKTFEFDGEVEANAGRFVMVFIPGVSENPFTVAYDRPLRLTVKVRGEDDGSRSFTNRLFAMREGDRLQITGPKGNCYADLIDYRRPLYVVMGGCGAAGLPLLERELSCAGAQRHYIFGARSERAVPQDMFDIEGSGVTISTEDGSFGVRGTVLDAIQEAFDEQPPHKGAQAIVCGPRKMIIAAADAMTEYINPGDIAVSLETYMKCGRGECASCECDGYHICADGPNLRYSDIMDAPDFRHHKRGKSGALEPL